MMSLDEAIKHAEEVADTPCFTDEEAKCYSEHRQLAEWLKELKELRRKYARLRRECNEVIDEICRLREAKDDGR